MAEVLGQPPAVDLGNFAEGEWPDPVSYQFLDALGNPIDLSAQTQIDFDFSKDGGTPIHGTGATQLDPTDVDNSTVEYAWVTADAGMTKGHFAGRFWVELPTNRYASVLINWYVGDAIKGP